MAKSFYINIILLKYVVWYEKQQLCIMAKIAVLNDGWKWLCIKSIVLNVIQKLLHQMLVEIRCNIYGSQITVLFHNWRLLQCLKEET